MIPDFTIVEKFEQEVAKFFGAPYAVAVDSCTHGLELCLRYVGAKYISCARNTYLSVPMLANKLDLPLFWQKKDNNWINYYHIGNNIYDAAVLWKKDSYISGSMMCISMQYKKHLGIGRLGVILVDDENKWLKLKKMSYDGRLPNIPWRDQNVDTMGFHYYAQPELCELALSKLNNAINSEPKKWVALLDWPDLTTTMIVFKNKYQKIYNQLVEKAQSEDRKKGNRVYYESHHIIPRCLGGSNDKNNLVLFTGREHFIAHKLLCLMFPNENKFKFGLWKMIKQSNKYQERNYIVSGREYEKIRADISKAVSETFKAKWQDPIFVEMMKKVHKQKIIKYPDLYKKISEKGIQRYKDPNERRKTGEAISKSLQKDPEALKKRNKAISELFKNNPELLKNAKRFGKDNVKWQGYCYVYDNSNNIKFTFENKSEAAKFLKCKNITNNMIPKKGKYKGYKFVISKNKLNDE